MMDMGTTAITGIHLTIIVVLAIAAVAAILWGMKLKRDRVAAAERLAANQDDARDATLREQAELGEDPLLGGSPSSPPAPSSSQSQSQVQSQDAYAPIADAASMAVDHANAPVTDGTMASTDAPFGGADRPVTVLKGLGPKVAAALADRGITTVGQIAALDASQAEALDADLGPFRGRMERDRWIEQARFLAAGDVTGFEAVFGRL